MYRDTLLAVPVHSTNSVNFRSKVYLLWFLAVFYLHVNIHLTSLQSSINRSGMSDSQWKAGNYDKQNGPCAKHLYHWLRAGFPWPKPKWRTQPRSRRKALISSLYLTISHKIANLKDRISMNHQKLQIFMLCLRSIYASMTFNCPWCWIKSALRKFPSHKRTCY